MAADNHDNSFPLDADDCRLAIRLILDGRPKTVQVAALRGVSDGVIVIDRTRAREIVGILLEIADSMEQLSDELSAPMGTLAVEKTKNAMGTWEAIIRQRANMLNPFLSRI